MTTNYQEVIDFWFEELTQHNDSKEMKILI
jgi:predicted RNase H-like HicB family nuclease